MKLKFIKPVVVLPPDLTQLAISDLAAIIRKDWQKVYFGAVPYLEALGALSSIDDPYYADTGRSVVAYFLGNATTWKGDNARAIKKELNRRLAAK